MKYTDERCARIERNFSPDLAAHADRNLAGWLLDLLADDSLAARRGPLAGRRLCDVTILPYPHLLTLVRKNDN